MPGHRPEPARRFRFRSGPTQALLHELGHRAFAMKGQLRVDLAFGALQILLAHVVA